MASQALNLIMQAIGSCSVWFTTLLDSVGAGGLYIAFIAISFSIAFLLAHFGTLFSLGSDNARRLIKSAADSESAYMRRRISQAKQAEKKTDS